ncbi:MAG TPA: hypothetical protein GX505_09310 [Clostridiales bacterium]|nr:hypothetical protein [Clostridiales bacterium]
MDKNKVEQLIGKLENIQGMKASISAVAGFDGFIDIITRPIASGCSATVKSYYNDISEFASFISQRAGSSSSIELVELSRKIGGNAPIFANALGRLGVFTTCIGAFGYPEQELIFEDISENCNIISVAKPGTCTALEFNDGKIMLASNGEINTMNWEMIVQRAGLDRIRTVFGKSQLIGLFNWSETPMADDIWNGILTDILPFVGKDKRILFDFSDCARRNKNEIFNMLNIVSRFGQKVSTTVSMNENEAIAALEALGILGSGQLEESGEILRQRLSAEHIIWHFSDSTIAFSKDGMHRFGIYKIKYPLLTTGAGDNFNAGLGFGLLSGLSLDDAVITASMTASYYVANGSSPVISELIAFMGNCIPFI